MGYRSWSPDLPGKSMQVVVGQLYSGDMDCTAVFSSEGVERCSIENVRVPVIWELLMLKYLVFKMIDRLETVS